MLSATDGNDQPQSEDAAGSTLEGGAEGSISAREAVQPAEASPEPETEEAASDAGAAGAAPLPEPGATDLGS
eukprot:9955863-Alexandrium_andersonii.AAC.1